MTATRSPPCLCWFLRFGHRRTSPRRERQEGPDPPPPPSRPRACEASGLRPALLHCSSFRYFHSPCRVLCTFRSRYLCNIGCQPGRGIFSETPQRASGCRFKQPYTGGGSKPQEHPQESQSKGANTNPQGFHLRFGSGERFLASALSHPSSPKGGTETPWES